MKFQPNSFFRSPLDMKENQMMKHGWKGLMSRLYLVDSIAVIALLLHGDDRVCRYEEQKDQ